MTNSVMIYNDANRSSYDNTGRLIAGTGYRKQTYDIIDEYILVALINVGLSNPIAYIRVMPAKPFFDLYGREFYEFRKSVHHTPLHWHAMMLETEDSFLQ
jgi:hypothetical protein